MTEKTDSLPIEVKALTKTYRLGFFMTRRVKALQGIDLVVRPGEVYGLLGPNGAGKSTTIKILMNLVQPTSGQALLFGAAPSNRRTKHLIGFLPENPSPYEYLTGEEFLKLAGRLHGLSGHELDQRYREVIGSVGMERAASLQIRRYSKGMIQRLALAQALINRPRLLVLDEPTSGLDPVGRRQMRDLILEERQKGTTVLFCTHIIPDVEALCDRVGVLVGGRLVKEGSVQELVTAQVPLVEIALENTTAKTVQGMGFPLESMQELGHRVLVKVSDSTAQPLMKSALDAGARITSVQPARFSLEELFLEALKAAGPEAPTVGGEIHG